MALSQQQRKHVRKVTRQAAQTRAASTSPPKEGFLDSVQSALQTGDLFKNPLFILGVLYYLSGRR